MFVLTGIVPPAVAGQDAAFSSVGWLSAYDAEPSEATLAYRYENGHVQWGFDAYVAVADCTFVGHTGTLEYVDSGMILTVQVFDCSGHDAEPGTAVIESAGFVAELDYASWKHYGLGKVILTIN